MTLGELYATADKNKISVMHMPMREVESASFPCGEICMDADKLADRDDEKTHLAHEMGHIVRAAFYNVHATLDLRAKHECAADRWAIKTLVPKPELDELADCGYVLPGEVAEYFGVTRALAEKAIEYYNQYGGGFPDKAEAAE